MILSTENGLLRHNSIESWEKSVSKMSLYRRCITVAFTQWKILGWFPVFGDHKYSCHEYSGTDFCVNVFHFSSINTQECALLSCKVSEYLSLCKSLGMFSRITGPFAHQQYEWSNFSASLPEFGIVSIFNFSLYDRCEVVFLCGFICTSLTTNNTDHISICLFPYHIALS